MKNKTRKLGRGGLQQRIVEKWASVLFVNGMGTPFETKEVKYKDEVDLQWQISPRGSVTKRYEREKIIYHR